MLWLHFTEVPMCHLPLYTVNVATVSDIVFIFKLSVTGWLHCFSTRGSWVIYITTHSGSFVIELKRYSFPTSTALHHDDEAHLQLYVLAEVCHHAQ